MQLLLIQTLLYRSKHSPPNPIIPLVQAHEDPQTRGQTTQHHIKQHPLYLSPPFYNEFNGSPKFQTQANGRVNSFEAPYSPTSASKKYICERCETPLKPNKKSVLLDGKLYHSQCFVCSSCSGTLDQVYRQRDGSVFCSKCYDNSVESTSDSASNELLRYERFDHDRNYYSHHIQELFVVNLFLSH